MKKTTKTTFNLIHIMYSGKWSSPLPKCVLKKCPVPELTDNGSVRHATSRRIGSTATYVCWEGYEVKSENNTRSRYNFVCVFLLFFELLKVCGERVIKLNSNTQIYIQWKSKSFLKMLTRNSYEKYFWFNYKS